MSGAHEPKPWFRPKAMGIGWTPDSWQGWAITLVFCLAIIATTQLVLPQSPRMVEVFPWLAALRRDLGVPLAGLGPVALGVAVALEVGVFTVVAWWTSRPVKPMD
jgi:hypothetical protein